jgi:drug/metabolite transporter (DMT)-like permease
MESSPLRNRLLLVAAALLFSTGGAAFKATTMNAWQVAGFRSGIAAIVLIAALPEARRGWSLRIVPVAVAYAATLITFVVANKLTTAANAIFLQSTAPLYLLLLGPLLLREPIRRADVLFQLGVLAGVALVCLGSQSPEATAPDPGRGNAIALVSGLTYALMLIGFRWLSRHGSNPGLAAAALGNVIACVCALPMGLPVRHATALDAGVLLYLGVFQIGLAYICLTRALRHVPAVEATTVLMIEPAMSPVWTWIVHGENPGALPLAGGAMILAAGLINTWRRARTDAAAAASAPPAG